MPRLFPISLLDAPGALRIRYFAECTIQHPILDKVTKQLWRALNSQVEESLIFIYGPAGVGKTTLCEHVVNKLIERNKMLTDLDMGKKIPVAFVNAAAPDNNRFDWKQFYQHSIFTMESSIAHNNLPKFTRYNPRLAPALYFSEKTTSCEYRGHFIETLKKHSPYAFFIDEAQHLAKVKSADSLLNQMDILKTIRKSSKTTIVLVGPYDLVPFRNLSGQLSRRSWDIHFSRYNTSDEHLTGFQEALLTLQRKLPLIVEPDLISNWKYIYAKSVGCIGIMKDWLLRSLEIAVSEDQNTITLDILKQCSLSDSQCQNIALEIVDGEQLVRETDKSYETLLKTLGFQDKKQKTAPVISTPTPPNSIKKPIVVKNKPVRKAKRHAVGKRLDDVVSRFKELNDPDTNL